MRAVLVGGADGRTGSPSPKDRSTGIAAADGNDRSAEGRYEIGCYVFRVGGCPDPEQGTRRFEKGIEGRRSRNAAFGLGVQRRLIRSSPVLCEDTRLLRIATNL